MMCLCYLCEPIGQESAMLSEKLGMHFLSQAIFKMAATKKVGARLFILFSSLFFLAGGD